MSLPAPQLHNTLDFPNAIFILSFTLILLINEGIKTGSYYLSVADFKGSLYKLDGTHRDPPTSAF